VAPHPRRAGLVTGAVTMTERSSETLPTSGAAQNPEADDARWCGYGRGEVGGLIEQHGDVRGEVAVSDGRAPNTALHGRLLVGARVGWLMVAGLSVGLAAGGFVVGFRRPELISQQIVTQAVTQAGIPVRVALAIGLVLPMLGFALTGVWLFWRKSNDWMAMLVALTFVTVGAFMTRSLWALERAYPQLRVPVRFVLVTAWVMMVLLLCLFPDGRFVPSWTRLLAAVAVAVFASLPDLPTAVLDLPDPPVGIPGWRWLLMVLAISALLGGGIVAQAYRYRHVSSLVQQQQTKWVISTMGALLLVILVAIVIPSTFTSTANPWFAWTLLGTIPLVLLVPVSFANAILRHRLYEIDRIINRTLVYALLTAVLGVTYAGVVLGLGQLFGGIATEPPSWAVAGATLAVAALFQPARRRIQATVDQRFNRRHYDAARTVEAFSARLRDEVDLDTLSAELLAVADQTMEPTTAWLWLRPAAGRARPIPPG
jgi:hypothetical protein